MLGKNDVFSSYHRIINNKKVPYYFILFFNSVYVAQCGKFTNRENVVVTTEGREGWKKAVISGVSCHSGSERLKEVSLHELQKVLGGFRENNWQWRCGQQLVAMAFRSDGDTRLWGH